MTTLTIKTNHQPRNTLTWDELSEKERAEFSDYLETDEQRENATFMRYRGWCYNLGEFLSTNVSTNGMAGSFPGWDGYAADSFSSGVLVKFVDEYDSVIAATYYS